MRKLNGWIRYSTWLFLSLLFPLMTNAGEPAMGPLTVHAENPRYFSNPSGKVVYLTGSHTWACFQERGIEGKTPDFDYPAFLDFLTQHNHNFLRMWTLGTCHMDAIS